MLKYYAFYMVIMNVAGFFTMHHDKRMARKRKRRISEKVLFGIAVAGGCYGSYFGMRLCHHKTRHNLFSVGLPLLLLLHTFLAVGFMLSLLK